MRKMFLAAVLLLPRLAYADPLVQESVPSAIMVEKDGDNYRVTTDSRRYQTNILPSVAGDNVLIYQLLEIEQHQVAVEGPQIEQNVESATARITAYPLGRQGKGEAAFTIDGKADAVAAQNSFVTLTRYGCCVEMPTYAVYSLETGNYLFNATGEGHSGQWATMGGRGGFGYERIFAYHAKVTAADDELFGDEANGAVIVTYAMESKPLQRIMVVATQDDMEHDAPLEWMPKIDLVSAAYPKGVDRIFVDRGGDAAGVFTDATVRLTLDEATVIEIPLVGDRLDLKAAKLPQGYKLKAMKL